MLNLEDQNENYVDEKIEVFIDRVEVDYPILCLFIFYRFYIY